MEIKIYGLVDPKNNQIRYIGKTQQPLKRRLTQHIYDNGLSNKYKYNWINKLKNEGLKPQIIELETCNEENWVEREKFHIKNNNNLTNLTDGGESGLFFTKEIIKKISDGLKKKWLEEGFKESFSLRMKEYWSDPLNREESSKRMTGKKMPLSHEIKQRNRKLNEWKENKYKEKMSIQSKKLWEDKEYIDKTLKFLKSDEHKKMVSDRFKNCKLSEEHKKKMSISSKNKKPVIIDGVEFESITEASKLIPINRDKLKVRIKSKHFVNYNYKETPQ
jgi:hypothetical protein